MFRKPSHDPSCSTRPRIARAYTLVELLIVVAILGIVAGIAITSFEPSLHDQLNGAAQVVMADLAYARSLAVANNSQYKITFDPANQKYWLEHSGPNTSLNSLPESPYRDSTDPATRQTTSLRKLPSGGLQLELAAVRNVSTTTQAETTRIDFGTLGALTQVEDCWIWLSIGQGDARRYLSIQLDAVTGLARIGQFQIAGPPAVGASVIIDGGDQQVSAAVPGP